MKKRRIHALSVLLILATIFTYSLNTLAAGPMRRGIDVSDWQRKIDWRAVKNSGVQFAMIRSGWSTGLDDPRKPEIDERFCENVKAAKAVGMPIGVYHYSYARTVQEARKEAEHCLNIIRKSGVRQYEYPIVFDIEDQMTLNATKSNKRIMTDMVIAFCEKIRSAGYYPAFYANPNWLNNYLHANELTARYDLWLAHYSGSSTPSRPCAMWQYTNRGRIAGITTGNVDLDYCYRDYPAIMRSRHVNGY